MTALPKAFTTPRTLITTSRSFLADMGLDLQYREQDRETGVEHDHQEHRFHHRARGELADAGGVALDLQPFEAADQSDDDGEDRRLDDADQEGVHRHRLVELAHERWHGDA